MATKTKRFEMFQDKGADATVAEATEKFRKEMPGVELTKVDFEYAYPGGRPDEGRWVGMKVEYEVAEG